MKIWNIGYPRVSQENEWFPAVRSFELGNCSEESLLEIGKKILSERWKTQHELGVDSIPLNDFSIWDPLLDTAWLFNLLPQAMGGGDQWIQSQLSLIRGSAEQNVRAMNRFSWFRTPYQSFQPEWDGKISLRLNREKIDWEIKCQKGLPYQFHITLIGPWTLAYVTKTQGRTRAELLKELAPLYSELLRDLKKKGFEWVQLEEPAFCVDLQKDEVKNISSVYDGFKGPLPKILITTHYESPDPWLTEFSQLPVQGFHYDLVSGPAVLSWIKTRSFPKDKLLGLGLVNGLNVWASSVASLYKQIEILKGFHPAAKLLLSPSCSLAHLPLTKNNETGLKAKVGVYDNLSFANERIEELALLKQMLLGNVSLSDVEKAEAARREKLIPLQKKVESVRNQINRLDLTFRKRGASFAKRSKTQAKRLGLPRLPMTVCQDLSAGCCLVRDSGNDVVLTDSLNYEQRLTEYTKRWSGFMSTEGGWVQISGSSCVRPPIIVSDIEWKDHSKEERSKTMWTPGAPLVKAVALGPVSIINLSFIRSDIPREQVVLQAAVAVRSEVKALETRGAPIIQIDEPGLTESVPLKKQKISVFLKHQMDNLKVATCGVKDETSLHLNLDNAELPVLVDTLPKSDVDVLYFSTSSGSQLNEKLLLLKGISFECGFGPGIIGQRDESIPADREIEINIRKCFEVIPPDKLWICADVPIRVVSEEYARTLMQKIVLATLRIRRLLAGNA
jgi:5-methyltetrahydropteroyltriglutamate--homocysteine methyltransferase